MQEEQRGSIVAVCQQMHKHVQRVSADFYSELSRRNYVTPTSFLELLSTFDTLLTTKRAENEAATRRYTVGLEKLDGSAAAVAGMQAELTALQPQLVATVADVEALMAQVAAEKTDVVAPKAEARAALYFCPPPARPV